MKKNRNVEKESLLASVKPSKAIVDMAVPATLALLAKAVYNIVDTSYIGMLNSDIALAAVGVTLPLLLIMVSIENIFAAGAGVLAGRQLGENDKEEANRTVTTIVGFSVAVGIGYGRGRRVSCDYNFPVCHLCYSADLLYGRFFSY